MTLRYFSKILFFSTLFLIFIGGLVKSTESGLSVPDWPTTYGRFMFAFPMSEMVGGIRYEHTHRMVASIVGLLTLALAFWLNYAERRRWVKVLGWAALFAVILQGILGGLTVRYFLPTSISVAHGMLAQTFFLMTITLAYSQSRERKTREGSEEKFNGTFLKLCALLLFVIYVQLILGAVMRHTESGLAIPDFPTMGGYIFPPFNNTMLNHINLWCFEHNLDLVSMAQVKIHFLHRFWALVVVGVVGFLTYFGFQNFPKNSLTIKTLIWLNGIVMTQIFLGIITVLSQKEVITTTLHVTTGAVLLGLSMLLILRSSPLSWGKFLVILSPEGAKNP